VLLFYLPLPFEKQTLTMNWDSLPRIIIIKEKLTVSDKTYFKVDIRSNFSNDLLDQCWCLRYMTKSKKFLLSNEFKSLFGLQKVFAVTRETKKCIFIYLRICDSNETPNIVTLFQYKQENNELSENLLSQIRSIFALRALFCVNYINKNHENSIAIVKCYEKVFALSYFEAYPDEEKTFPIPVDYIVKQWFYDDYQFFQKTLLKTLGFSLLENQKRVVFNEEYKLIQKKLDDIEIELENIIRRIDADELTGFQLTIMENINIHVKSIK
jgi:hypothetical protein